MREIPKQDEDWIGVLRRAEHAGRKAIEDNYDIESRLKVTKRGVGGDLTLKIDEASEAAIHKSLLRDLGDDSFIFVSEEMGEVSHARADAAPIIMCDPLDGSHNAQVGIPLFAISLCVLGIKRTIKQNEKRYFQDVDIALILNVSSGDEFYAIKSKGAFHNGKPITGLYANKHKRREGAAKQFHTLGIECGDADFLKAILAEIGTKDVYKIRLLGSAALGHCFLAEGTFDGYIFAQPGGARTIDSPAGYLIARESGRVLTDLESCRRNLDRVEVGFDSRINMIGASDRAALSDLISLVKH